jgi:hypothetical protein
MFTAIRPLLLWQSTAASALSAAESFVTSITSPAASATTAATEGTIIAYSITPSARRSAHTSDNCDSNCDSIYDLGSNQADNNTNNVGDLAYNTRNNSSNLSVEPGSNTYGDNFDKSTNGDDHFKSSRVGNDFSNASTSCTWPYAAISTAAATTARIMPGALPNDVGLHQSWTSRTSTKSVIDQLQSTKKKVMWNALDATVRKGAIVMNSSWGLHEVSVWMRARRAVKKPSIFLDWPDTRTAYSNRVWMRYPCDCHHWPGSVPREEIAPPSPNSGRDP